MSTTYAYNVGLGLNFSGPDDEREGDMGMSGYPQESNYDSFSPGNPSDPIQTDLKITALLLF